MFICIMLYIGHSGKILPNEIAQNSIAFSMQNAHTTHANQNGIINEILHCIQGFIASHATNIKILMEILLMVINRIACCTAYLIGSFVAP